MNIKSSKGFFGNLVRVSGNTFFNVYRNLIRCNKKTRFIVLQCLKRSSHKSKSIMKDLQSLYTFVLCPLQANLFKSDSPKLVLFVSFIGKAINFFNKYYYDEQNIWPYISSLTKSKNVVSVEKNLVLSRQTWRDVTFVSSQNVSKSKSPSGEFNG